MGRGSEVVESSRSFLRGDAEVSKGDERLMLRDMERAAREATSPLERLETLLHPWQAFAIVPIFALANAGVAIDPEAIRQPVATAVALGLVVGKPLGIVVVSWLAVRLGLARLPEGVTWPAVLGGGALAGIGFTMSLFIAGLAFRGLDPELVAASKLGILLGSLLAGLLGMALLWWILPRPATEPRS